MSKINNYLLYLIINSIIPYAYEINNILGKPTGLDYRVRYKRKWISQDLIEKITKGDFSQQQLSRRPVQAIIILRDFSTGYFVPLRYVELTTVNKYSNVYYLGYRLGRLYRYSWSSKDEQDVENIEDFSVLQKIKSDIEAELRSLGNIENRPGTDLEKLAFEASTIPGLERPEISDDEAWGYIVNILRTIKVYRAPSAKMEAPAGTPRTDEGMQSSKLHVYKDFDFIRIVSIREGGSNITSRLRQSKSGDNRLILRSAAVSEISILQRTYTLSSGKGDSGIRKRRKVALTSVPHTIQVVPSEKNITGKYEWFSFHVATPHLRSKTTYGTLFLSIERQDSYKSTQITIPILVTYRYFWEREAILVIGALSFILGVILIFASKGTLNKIGIVLTVLGGMVLRSDIDDIISILSVGRVA